MCAGLAVDLPGAADTQEAAQTCPLIAVGEAWDVLQTARAMLDTVHNKLITERNPLDQLTPLYEQLGQIQGRTQKQLDKAALAHITRADKCATDSYHYVWFNNRETVRKGLIELRWVTGYKDQLNADTRADFFRTLHALAGRCKTPLTQAV